MNASQSKKAGLAVLVVVMVLVYARALRPPGSGSEAPEPPVPVEASSGSSDGGLVALNRSTSREAQRQQLARLEWKRDPFTQGLVQGHVSGLVLSGILWDPVQPMALINGALVKVGDALGDYHIIDIAQDHVSLTDGTQNFKMHITQ